MADVRDLTIQQALEWAFRAEKAQLDPPSRRIVETPSFGMEYVLLQRAELGCTVDTSRKPLGHDTHEDAEAIAAVVGRLPSDLGGWRMALTLAECGRSGATPDWMPDARPRLVPVAWGRNGEGKTERCGVWPWVRVDPHPRNPRHVIRRTVRAEAYWTPCIWDLHPLEIERARAFYVAWWTALDEVRVSIEGLGLRTVRVNRRMPPMRPWLTRERLAGGSRPASTA